MKDRTRERVAIICVISSSFRVLHHLFFPVSMLAVATAMPAQTPPTDSIPSVAEPQRRGGGTALVVKPERRR